MPEQLTPLSILFFLLYGAGTATAALLCLYMLSPGKIIAPNVKSSTRLRHWTAAFFGTVTLSSTAWFLFYLLSNDEQSPIYAMLELLDSIMMPTVFAGTLLAMLQDKQRPLWPIIAALAPIPVFGLLDIITPAINLTSLIIVYGLILIGAFIIYMVACVRQYSRWLRDNYADLEHKEVWQSHLLLIVFMLVLVFYGFTTNYVMSIVVHILAFILFALLLWRVDTLPLLTVELVETEASNALTHVQTETEGSSPQTTDNTQQETLINKKGQPFFTNIGKLLAEHCENKQLYLQHDLSLIHLASTVGINRTYLSNFFSNQGTSYNSYINNLRINHFVTLYRKMIAENTPFTIQQLAKESGYRSYSTFSSAFKQYMGESVASWIKK